MGKAINGDKLPKNFGLFLVCCNLLAFKGDRTSKIVNVFGGEFLSNSKQEGINGFLIAKKESLFDALNRVLSEPEVGFSFLSPV